MVVFTLHRLSMLELISGLVLVLFLIVFLFYGAVTMRHAARFRYLSKRTVYLTLIFVSGSTLLLGLALISYAFVLFGN